LKWSVHDPAGSLVFDRDLEDVGPILLDQTGQYTLAIAGKDASKTGPYQFVIHDVPDPETRAIVFDEPVDGHILVPGEFDIYTFHASAGQTLYFDHTFGSFWDFQWNLTDPGGARLFSVGLGDQGPMEMGQDGQYTLVVDGKVDGTGSYQFVIYDVPDPPVTPITYGQVVGGELTVPAEQHHYTFLGIEGQRLYFDVQDNGSFRLGFTLQAPDGSTVFQSVVEDQVGFDLPQSGEYTLIVAARTPEHTGSYRFRLFELIEPPPEPAGPPDSKGHEFWLAFPGNLVGGFPPPPPLRLQLLVSAEQTTECTLIVPSLGY
jgi:hypothetical protein